MKSHIVCAILCVVGSIVPAASAATPAQIQQTIAKAKKFIYAQQNKDHNWEDAIESHGDQTTGQTALALYALLTSGESHQDARLAPALDYLKKTPATGVYALGLRCQVWLNVPPTADVRGAVSRDARTLLSSMKRTGEGKGFYDYNPAGRTSYSHSRAQYGVLVVWAASQMGIEVPRDYWQIVEKAWIEDQDPSGGWAYYAKPKDDFPITAGMTAVGIATLFITQDYLHAGEGLNCGGNIHNPAIERGMKWLSDNFNKVASDEKYLRAFPYSTLYAVERIGVASGQKYFNGIDWYEKGADWLVKQQRSDGSFPYDIGAIKISSACLSILFLTRGSSPLMMNKLDYSAATVGTAAPEAPAGKTAARAKAAPTPAQAGDNDPHWNQRPRDVANLTRWLGRQIERDLNWQVVNLAAPVDELHDAPILYIAGHQELKFSAEQEAKIKQFIEQGGLVLGHADCAAATFSTSFRALGQKMFPVYEFAPLPESHVIYTNEQYPRTKWTRKPTVLSLGNRAREFMILLPDGDPAKAWQMQNPGGREEQFQLPADIFLYSVDRQSLRRRGESYLVKANAKVKPTKTIKVARLQYSGNWDPEPGGWRRLAAVMNNTSKVAVETTPVKLVAGSLAGYSIAHMTGTDAFKLDAIAQNEVKQFVSKGGTLIIDSTGGSSAFASAAEAELAAMFPNASTQLADALPLDHAIYTKGEKLPTIAYRNFARTRLGQLKGPQLRAVKVGDRAAVIYSREDLSVGLVGHAVDGIVGYDPDSATALMRNTLLYAATVKK